MTVAQQAGHGLVWTDILHHLADKTNAPSARRPGRSQELESKQARKKKVPVAT